MFKKLFASKELKLSLGVLDAANYLFNSSAFTEIKNQVEKYLYKYEKNLIIDIQGGRSPRICVYSVISNIIADMIGTGEFHIYRGVLSMYGQQFLEIYCKIRDELEKSGALTPEEKDNMMSFIKDIIKESG